MKLSSGQKFKDASEDASGYSMSERMIEKIRALYQDDQNIQNGSAMVKTAERGIAQIVENLRTMKELALDAANDSNTDEDRHTIQKEMDQRRKLINDIALGTKYNGRILLDGRYSGGVFALVDGAGGLNSSIQNLSQSSFFTGNGAQRGSYSTNGGSGDWKFNVNASFGRSSGSTY